MAVWKVVTVPDITQNLHFSLAGELALAAALIAFCSASCLAAAIFTTARSKAATNMLRSLNRSAMPFFESSGSPKYSLTSLRCAYTSASHQHALSQCWSNRSAVPVV